MSNPTELPDLLPCPFCGNKAELHEEFRSAGYRAIECAECGANVGAVDLERGIEMWNRRAQPEGEAPQAAAHRATIEEAAQVFESGAAHNRKAGRTVFAHAQQDRANRLRATIAAPAAQLDGGQGEGA